MISEKSNTLISTYFTKNEAIKKYNINKIKYDSYNYSLKNKLILDTFKTFNRRNAISTKSTSAEKELFNIIKTNCSKYKTSEISEILDTETSIHYGDLGPFSEKSFNVMCGCDDAIILNNDLYINLEHLVEAILYEKYLEKAPEVPEMSKECLHKEFKNVLNYLDKSNILDAILQLICALTRQDSLIPNLAWLLTKDFNVYDLNNVNDLEVIDDNFKNHGKFYGYFNENTVCGYMPYKSPLNIPHTITNGYKNGMFDGTFFDFFIGIKEALIPNQFKKVILFGIEILNAISTISNKDYQNKLYSLLLTNFDKNPKICKFIKKYLYDVDTCGNIVINEDVLKIIAIEKMNDRYLAIQSYINSITDYPNYAMYYNAVEYVPIFLGIFVKFCLDYSIRSIRIKLALYLMNILKEENIKLKNTDSDFEMFGDIEEFSEALSELNITDENLNNDLFDFHFNTYDEEDASDSTTKDYNYIENITKKSASNEILDRALATFNEAGYDFEIENVNNVDFNNATAKDTYNTIYSKIKLISQNLSKRIKEIKTYNEGGKNSGLSKGKLDKKNLYRHSYDKNIFYNNTYKIRESDLAFGILLDASGSMCGKAIEDGKITMIVLHEVLKSLGINHCIATHTSYGHHDCKIKKYVQFKENANYNFSKCYPLVNIKAKSGNCDSGALYFMEKELLRTKNKDKICLIFSDGEPTECTDTELRDQIKHMEKIGIKVIGIGINFESIKDYYNDYANGKTLKDMLDITANILQQYVLDKKD